MTVTTKHATILSRSSPIFTIKFYGLKLGRLVIEQADSFTILRDPVSGRAEITLHRKGGDDVRRDVTDEPAPDDGVAWPPRFSMAIIENQFGKTTEMVRLPMVHVDEHAIKPNPHVIKEYIR